MITGAHATKVLLAGSRATGVEYRRKKEKCSVRASAEVVLCGGVFQSPQLLMLSGVGDGNALGKQGIATRHELKGVGLNLHDHLGYAVQASCPQPLSLAGIARPHNALLAGMQYLCYRSGPLARPRWEVSGMLNSGVCPDAHPDIKLILVLMMGPPAGIDGRTAEGKPKHGLMARLSMTQPESRGSLRLQSADPCTPPLLDPNFLAEEIDRQRVRESVRLAVSVFEQPAYQPFLGDSRYPAATARSDAQIDNYIRSTAMGDNHAVGTCRMGSDDDSVVDDKLRVHGVDNLRIADASVIPRVISGNTNAPVIMIAERAADFILSSWPVLATPGPPGSHTQYSRCTGAVYCHTVAVATFQTGHTGASGLAP